ncbi:MAG: response regulator [bacterium]|nr:response regulator [bacterium]
MTPKTALIVDDSRTARKLVRRALPDAWDVDIVEASGGREAITILKRLPVDVMFLDLTMPEVDGYTVLKWLRDHELSPIVIVVSGDLQPQAGARVMMLGAFEFVGKPIDSDKMHAVLELAGVL